MRILQPHRSRAAPIAWPSAARASIIPTPLAPSRGRARSPGAVATRRVWPVRRGRVRGPRTLRPTKPTGGGSTSARAPPRRRAPDEAPEPSRGSRWVRPSPRSSTYDAAGRTRQRHEQIGRWRTGAHTSCSGRPLRRLCRQRLLVESRLRTGACARLGPGARPVALSSAVHAPSDVVQAEAHHVGPAVRGRADGQGGSVT